MGEFFIGNQLDLARHSSQLHKRIMGKSKVYISGLKKKQRREVTVTRVEQTVSLAFSLYSVVTQQIETNESHHLFTT